jgi:hypothetical protein
MDDNRLRGATAELKASNASERAEYRDRYANYDREIAGRFPERLPALEQDIDLSERTLQLGVSNVAHRVTSRSG